MHKKSIKKIIKAFGYHLPFFGAIWQQRDHLLTQVPPDYFTSKQTSFQDFHYQLTKKDNKIIITSSNLTLEGKSDNTIWTGEEVLINTDYDFTPPSTNTKPWVMFDVGTNLATTSLYFAQKDFITHIYGYEPFTPTYKLAKRNLFLNTKLAPKISTFNYGLDNQNQELTISYNPQLPGSMSSLTDRYASDQNLTKEKIIIKNVTSVFRPLINKHQRNHNFFLKIDCEGAETNIVKKLHHDQLLAKFSVIIIEYHFGNA